MTKKIVSTFCFLILMVSLSFAQKIKIKDKIAYIDEQACFTLEMDGEGLLLSRHFFFKDLNGNDLFFLKTLRSPIFPDENYMKVIFPQNGKSLTILQGFETPQLLMRAMVKDGIIARDGKFDPGRIDIFVMKYDEDLESQQNVIVIDRNNGN